MTPYEKALKELNREQRDAVERIEGPLLVIAGPGTGKTQLLSVRVAYILQNTDTSPQNVLCLTFTNKAATNMRDRLFDFIGPDAYKVAVHTFHSFAADIMNEYPDYFWNGARLGTVPDTVQLEVIQEILTSLPLDNPLAKRFAGELTGTSNVQKALKLSKEAGLTPEKLDSIISVNLAYIDLIEADLVEILSETLSNKKLAGILARIEDLPEQPIDAAITPLLSLRSVLIESLKRAIAADAETGKATITSKWKQRFVKSVDGIKGMHGERATNEWWLELAHVYKLYRDKLHSRGYYDYSDMIVEVISQLEQNPELRSDVQERFSHVLIDEFQDTNPAQLRLAHLVADHHSSNGQPNLMAVGDDDQSIFKFNGAELSNMLNFRSFYKIEKAVVLVENYRSSQAILDTAHLLAEQINDRLTKREADIVKNLIAKNEPPVMGTIQHLSYPTREHQLNMVANQVAAERKKNTGTIAILARGHDSLLRLAEQLQTRGVAIRYERQNNALNHPIVVQVLLVCDLLVAINNGNEVASNVILSELLRESIWGVSTEALWQLAIDNRFRPHWIKSLLASEDPRVSKLMKNLMELARESTTAPLSLMIEYVVGLRPHNEFTSPLRARYFKDKTTTSSYLEALSALRLLIDLTHEFSTKNEANLADFMQFVHINRENNRLITDSSVYLSGNDAVQLLTVHKAKGLEFDSVYVIDANEEYWKPHSGGRKSPVNLPLQAYGEDADDYARLFYVAATRAKHSLFVSSFYSNAAGDSLLSAPFVRAVLPPQKIDFSEAGDAQTVLESALSWPQLAEAEEGYLLQPVLEEFTLSPTALLNFLDVTAGGPNYFKERDLLRLPEAKTISQSYGTAIHAALEHAQKLVNKSAFDIDEVLQAYDDALVEQHVSPEEFERYLPLGQRTLGTLFETYGYTLQPKSSSEQKLSCTLEGGVRLVGKLDRIDGQDKSKLVIADYKTGAPLTSLFTNDQSKAIKAWRHRSQLIFYALLANNTPRLAEHTAIECQMVYVESPDVKHLVQSYTPTAEEITRMTQLVKKAWRKIIAAEFPDTSGYTQDMAGIQKFEQDLLDGAI